MLGWGILNYLKKWRTNLRATIFGTAVIDDVLYILFKNYTLHILYMNGEHDILLLESQPSQIEKAKMKINNLFDINLN